MTKEKEFLDLFKKLEKYLRIEYERDNYSYSSFIRTIYRIKKTNKNRIISNKYNFDIIHQASQMRNILSHNTNVLIPTEKFIQNFRNVVEKICEPIKVRDIMVEFSKLKTITLESTVGKAIYLLKKNGYNTIPVIKNNQLTGIFTEKSLFDYLTIDENSKINKFMKIKEIFSVIDLNSYPRKYFDYINRNATIQEAYEVYNIDLRNRRELLLLLVTEHGLKEEKVLGIVTLRDVKNALLD